MTTADIIVIVVLFSCFFIFLIFLVLLAAALTLKWVIKPKKSEGMGKNAYQQINYVAPDVKWDNVQRNNNAAKVRRAHTQRSSVAPEVKGSEFEKFVLDKFNDKDFAIVEMTHKFIKPGDRYVESNLNPDFTFRHKISGITFSVEAKYRSHLNADGMLEWSNVEQLARYNTFAEQRGIPVYIVIGIGGMPSLPRELICIPLNEAKYIRLYPSVYKKYTRDVNTNFCWQNGILK